MAPRFFGGKSAYYSKYTTKNRQFHGASKYTSYVQPAFPVSYIHIIQGNVHFSNILLRDDFTFYVA